MRCTRPVIALSTNACSSRDMKILASLAIVFATTAFAVQIGSAAIASWRCRRKNTNASPGYRPAFTLVRPLLGTEEFSSEIIAASFAIDYPEYEILFCVANEADPVARLVLAAIGKYPQRKARLLVGEDAIGTNPKLNNMAKGFREARFDHIVFTDSNVLTPPHYLDGLAAKFEEGAGMVSAPPTGHRPEGNWAYLECAFLNSYQARVQYAVDTLGFGFAQGKTLAFRRADLERGGLARLASEPAEDAAATKMMHAQGKRIRLAGPFAQPLGRRTWAQVWSRQVRWARLRRASFPLLFVPEIFAGALPPLVAMLYAAWSFELALAPAGAAFLALWYLPEIVLIRIAGWPLSASALILRDLLLPVIYAAAWQARDFEWHGQKMTAFSSEEKASTVRSLPRRLRALLVSRAL